MKKSGRVLICGCFAFGELDNGGQPVKTRELYYALCKRYGKDNVECVETKRWKRNPFKLIWRLWVGTKRSDVLIMLPAHNGLEVFGRIFAMIKKHTGKKVFYDVIGGWLPEKLANEKALLNRLKLFDGIWVETSSMKTALNVLGLDNITVIPNFKSAVPIDPDKMVYQTDMPLRLCTFSRVMEEKGIEDAINAVKAINEEAGKTVYTLDIYGQIYEPYERRFEELKTDFPEYICYKGVANANEGAEILKNYFALLFPTHFYTEGVPGTLIDAYCAGVPVIAALWQNYGDVFVDGVTGFGYDFGNYKQFEELLKSIANDTALLNALKPSTLEFSNKFTSCVVVESIARQIGLGAAD